MSKMTDQVGSEPFPASNSIALRLCRWEEITEIMKIQIVMLTERGVRNLIVSYIDVNRQIQSSKFEKFPKRPGSSRPA